ncbi:MAG: acyl-CoA thioesterase [Enterovirga sp.]|jgi:4-hydroxybenzoyl-CoA thioesterase|nr:acyl-CoA thioesterase [Enterovirga sp.]
MDGFTNTRRLTVEWGHCDPAGIVFNPRFFEYFDYSTALLLEVALGLGKQAMMDRYGLAGIPIVETGARFMAPSRFGDVVEIESCVVELKRTSFGLRHRLTRAGVLSAEGRETRVWAGRHPEDPARLTSKPIPDEVAATLRGG